MSEAESAPGALVQADQPWGDAILAPLYDAFPFSADVPLYQELAATQGGRVLEIACGSGRVLVPLAAAGATVTGLDASPHMLALARAKLEAAGPHVAARARLVEGDMRAFQVAGPFDLAIIAVKSLAYLTSRADQQRALAAVAAHLRPGGLLALDLHAPRAGLAAGAAGQPAPGPCAERAGAGYHRGAHRGRGQHRSRRPGTGNPVGL